MALIGFEPDLHPNAPPGAGFALADSGERAYVVDPNLAAQFSGQAPASPQQAPQDTSYDLMSAADLQGSDQRLALGGQGGGRQGYNAPPQPTQSVADVGPNYSTPGDVPQAPAGPNASAAPPAAPNASVQGPQSSAATSPAQSQQPQAEVDPDEALRADQKAYVSAPVKVAGSPGGLREKSEERTVEGAGAPMSEAEWKKYYDLNEDIKQTHVGEAGVARAAADYQVAQAQAAIPALLQERDTKSAEYEQARSAAKQDLAKVNSLLQQVNTKQVDHNRFFQRRGAFGALAAGIAQALGASAATLSGSGHNMVADQINRMIDEDVAEQREQIENGRANANNALQMLRDRYNFDIPQAESALKIAQTGVVNAQLREYEGMKMSTQAQQGLESWMSDNNKKMFMEARSLYEQSQGKETRKIALVNQQGSAGGLRAPTEKEKQDRLHTVQLSQETGTTPKPGTGTENIPPALVVYDTNGKAVAARTEPEAVKVREKYAMYKKIMPSLASMDASAGHWNTLSPDEKATFKINFETAVSTLNSSLGQGQMKTDDFQRWEDYMSQGNFGVKKAIAEVRAITKNAYQAEVDSQTGGAVSEDFGKGKPKAKYNNKRATTPTVGRSQAGTSATPDELKAALAGFAQ